MAGVRDELGALDAFVAGRSGLKHHGAIYAATKGAVSSSAGAERTAQRVREGGPRP